MSELSILKWLCVPEFYQNYRSEIKHEYLTKEAVSILHTIDSWYKTAESASPLSCDDLSNLFFSTPRQKGEYYTEVFNALKANSASVESTVSLIKGLSQQQILRELSVLSYDASEGRAKLDQVLEKARGLSTNSEINNDPDEMDDFVTTDLVEIVNHRRSLEGLRWRLGSLNKALGPLRKGNFGFVFARPETGKTSFLASEVTYMAGQTSQPILWLKC